MLCCTHPLLLLLLIYRFHISGTGQNPANRMIILDIQTGIYDLPAIIGGVIICLTCSAFSILIVFFFLRKKQQHFHQIKIVKYEHEQNILNARVAMQEEIFRQVSEEIHDNIGQVLSLVKLRLGNIGGKIEGDTAEAILVTKDMVGKALSDLRDLSRSMHPDRIRDGDLQENIRQQLMTLESTGLYSTSIQIKGDPVQLQISQDMGLLRILQESITNALKHANGDHFNVVLSYSAEGFSMMLHDNGIGIDVSSDNELNKGIGLKSMQSRAILIGGVFTIGPGTKGGTDIRVGIPFTDNLKK